MSHNEISQRIRVTATTTKTTNTINRLQTVR